MFMADKAPKYARNNGKRKKKPESLNIENEIFEVLWLLIFFLSLYIIFFVN